MNEDPAGQSTDRPSDWRRWLDSHVNRELGVGVAPTGRQEQPSRSAIDALLDALGSPQRDFRAVVVAGTNGKTTVTHIVSALIEASGSRVGRYTSPHLERVNERIAVDGAPITDAALGDLIGRIAISEPVLDEPLSWFEIITAAAFTWFAQQHVDVAIIEVGLGGEWDATAAAAPELVAVTNIDLDHTEYFGATRHAIADAEAGIISPGTTVVLGETDHTLRPCFSRRNPRQLWVRDRDFAVLGRHQTTDAQILSLKTPSTTYHKLRTPLRGAAHAENVSLALTVAECAIGRLHEPTIRGVLASQRSPGRMELLDTQPLVLLDGAHNPAGMSALAAVLAESFPAGPRTFVLGVSRDKPVAELIRALELRDEDRVLCCTAHHPRAVSAESLADVVRATAPNASAVHVAPDVRDALRRARAANPAPALIVVAGSLYLVGDARHVLKHT